MNEEWHPNVSVDTIEFPCPNCNDKLANFVTKEDPGFYTAVLFFFNGKYPYRLKSRPPGRVFRIP